MGFTGGSNVKEFTGNVEDLGSILGSGRSPGEGNGYPLQYCCLDNPTDRGARRAAVSRVSDEWDMQDLIDRCFWHFTLSSE